MNGLPTVPVHDLRIHPREGELIAGTHGRSIYIADIRPLQQLAGGALPSRPVALQPRTAIQYGDPPVGGEFTAQRYFQGQSGRYGAEISFYVPSSVAEELAEAARAEREERMAEMREGAEEEGGEAEAGPPAGARAAMMAGMRGGRGGGGAQAQIAILDAAGDTVQTLNTPIRAGINRAYWTFNRRAAEVEKSPSERADSIRTARMYVEIADSLVANEGADREVVDRVLGILQGGDPGAMGRIFGGGGGGGGQAGGFSERPAESYPEPEAEGRGGPPGAAGMDPGAMRPVMMQMFGALRERGAGGFGRFFGGGGGGGMADPGTYSVAITIGDDTYTTSLEVVRKEGFGFWDEPDGEADRR